MDIELDGGRLQAILEAVVAEVREAAPGALRRGNGGRKARTSSAAPAGFRPFGIAVATAATAR